MNNYKLLFLFCTAVIQNVGAMQDQKNKDNNNSVHRKILPLKVLAAQKLYESGRITSADGHYKIVSETLCVEYQQDVDPKAIRHLPSRVVEQYTHQQLSSIQRDGTCLGASGKGRVQNVVRAFNIIVMVNS